MQARWFLSQFFFDSELLSLIPTAGAYGGMWNCPLFPSTPEGWALVQILTSPQQTEAARQDHRVLVLPYLMDPSPLDPFVISTYAGEGAVAGMSIGALLAKLSDVEPRFSQSI